MPAGSCHTTASLTSLPKEGGISCIIRLSGKSPILQKYLHLYSHSLKEYRDDMLIESFFLHFEIFISTSPSCSSCNRAVVPNLFAPTPLINFCSNLVFPTTDIFLKSRWSVINKSSYCCYYYIRNPSNDVSHPQVVRAPLLGSPCSSQ